MNHITVPMHARPDLNAHCIIVSARTAMLMLKKSTRGEWCKTYFQIFPVICCSGDMEIVLASPDADLPVVVAVKVEAWERALGAVK